jgi:hypothetical protein
MLTGTQQRIRTAAAKIFLIFLAVALVLPMVPQAVLAADTVLVNDTFDGYPAGPLSIGAGNTWTKEGAAPTFNVVQDTVTGRTYAAISHDGTGSSYIGQRFAAQNGGLILEFDINIPTNKGASLWVMDGKVNATTAAALRYSLDGGVIKRHNSTNQISYNVNHWYRFKIVFNVPQNKFTTTIVNLNTGDTVTWPDAFYSSRAQISSFSFFVNAGGGRINVDNVKVTALDLALSKLNLNSGSLVPELNPVFDPKVGSYTVDVPYSVNTLNVMPEASNPGAVSVKVNNSGIAHGSYTLVPLSGNTTNVGVQVVSSVYTDVYRTYNVTVNKLEKAPNLNFVQTEERNGKVRIGWEETMDNSYVEARVYRKHADQSETLVTTVPRGTYIASVDGLMNGTAYTFVVKGVYQYTGEAPIESSGVTVSATPKKLPARQLEALDRGTIAVKQSDGVYVGWRMLGTDTQDIAFNLYRDGVKVNSAPITGATNYKDTAGTAKSTYTIRPVVGGIEQQPTEKASVLDMNYFTIPLRKPADSMTPDGVAYSYRANDASVGDLDGDGQYEIVLKWDPTNSKDNSVSGYTGNTYVDAYKLDGTFMWRIDLGKNIRAGAHYLDVMVYDLDGDGKAEVTFRTADGTVDGKGQVIGDANADYRNASGYILTGPEYHTIFEGATGRALATDSYEPARGNVTDWGDNYGNRVDRFGAAIAYLDGERPSVVMQRGYYTRMVFVAYNWRDGQLTKLWTFESNTPGNGAYAGQGNHNLSVADVDGDGKDEIITGAAAIDHDGKGLWNSLLGHGDAQHLGDLDPTRLGLEQWAVQEVTSAKYSAEMKDAKTGRVLWGELQVGLDVGRGLTADIDPAYIGEEAWSINGEWNTNRGGLYSASGEKISSSIPSSNYAIWWDGDLTRELLDHNWLGEPLRVGVPKIDKWDTVNNQLNNIMTFQGTYSNNDTKGNPALQADVLGDWREEVIARTEDSSALRIYTTTDMTNHRIHTLMHDPVYRLGIAWQNTGYNQPPHTSFYLGNGMEQPEQPNIWTKPIKAAGITVTSSVYEIRVGHKLQLQASFQPAATSDKSVTWAVYDENGGATELATISSSGLLHGIRAGKVKVVASANDGSGATGHLMVTIHRPSDDSPAPAAGSVAAPQPTPSVTGGFISQQAAPNANGTASVEVKAEELTKAAANITAGQTLKVEIKPSAETKEVQLSLPAQQLSSVADKKVEAVEVDLGLAKLTIDLDLIKKVVGTASSKVELSVSKADLSGLPEATKEKLGDNMVYDFNFAVDGSKVNGFGQDLKVEVNYTLKPGEDPNKIVIYYIDEKGSLSTVKNGKYDPATGKVAFKPGHFSKYAAVQVNVGFTDIAHVSWAKTGIEALAARTIIDGVGEGAFKPDQKVTRAEFLKMLMQAFDLSDESAKSTLNDVKEGAWYYSSVAAAQKLGIVQGKADGSFGVSDEITREDMAVMAYRAAQQLSVKLKNDAKPAGFADQADMAGYAIQAVEAMQAGGVIQGIGEGKFAPKGQATRAQAAVVIYQLYLIQ